MSLEDEERAQVTPNGSGRPLEGVRVLDFGQYVAGPMAATLLADAGAEVTRIEPPGGPRFTDPGNAYLLRGRVATHVLDLKSPSGQRQALALVAGADVLIENFRPGVMVRLGLGAEACRDLNPGLVYCSLPGFSELDERAGVAGWEGVILAAGGAFTRQPGSPVFTGTTGQTPDFPSLPLASSFAAGMAALSACAALIARERDGGLGQRIEIPLADALLEGSGILTTRVEKQAPMRGGVFAPGLYRSRDDQVMCFTSGAFRHLEGLARVSGNAAWLADGTLDWHALRTDPEAPARWRAALVGLFATRDADEWEALLRPAGIPVARLRTTREWLREPAAEAAGCVVAQYDGTGRPVRTLRAAVDFEAADVKAGAPVSAQDGLAGPALAGPALAGPALAGPALAGPAGASPLTGIKVVDLCRVVAAPTVTRLLADLGAEVIKVDIDPAEARAAYDEPLFHVYLNRGKQGAILNLKVPGDRARFDALTAEADMLVTNVSAGRLPGLGLTPEVLREHNPALVFAYLNLYGGTGPWADYKGYAEIANCATGVSALTAGWATAPSGAPPVNSPPWPYTDSLAGVLSAFGSVAALYDRRRRGRTYRVNTSLAQTALLEQMPFAVDGADVDPARGRDTSSPAYRIYDAADRPVFVAIAADDLPEALRRLGAASADDIEAGIASRTADECVRALCFGRSAASPVEAPSATMAPDSFWARRGLRLERPSEDFGTVVTQAPVARFTRTVAVAGDTPRIFGKGQPDGWTR
jgi:crotonobetainyl-CoA:carnitine CoA-transferase CaiB-like acyl-CoA transferase